jgi:phenylalanyl-tRNA synthetase alpha chain
MKDIDQSLPGKKPLIGNLHPITQVERQVENFFKSLGFSVIEGDEIATQHYNFDVLRMPKNHPARDMQDTFYLEDGRVLRTHTSSVQVRFMESNKPPFRIIVPGRCWRNERTDSTHDAEFHQFECLVVGKNIKVSNFKAILEGFLKDMFGPSAIMRLRPAFFPYVEPGFEIDMKRKGDKEWLEMGGAGMVHPEVLENAGINPKKWRGFAWGFGLERIAMIKWGIEDIRLFHSGDLRFLNQFK